MFTKAELQVIGQTLIQRKEWLRKNLDRPERDQNEKLLAVIDSALQKVTLQLREQNPATRDTVNHYISEKTVSPIRHAAFTRRNDLVPGQIRVLLVDDDQLICELVAAYLRAAGIHLIDFANDGMRGISMMYDANPIYDLVLCDWNMPSKSGLDVHNAMRAAERYLGTVFMLVTAVSEAKQIRSAIEDGVDDYVVKPIEQDKLIKKIARFFPNVKIDTSQ